jgi:hypothetical protein
MARLKSRAMLNAFIITILDSMSEPGDYFRNLCGLLPVPFP